MLKKGIRSVSHKICSASGHCVNCEEEKLTGMEYLFCDYTAHKRKWRLAIIPEYCSAYRGLKYASSVVLVHLIVRYSSNHSAFELRVI